MTTEQRKEYADALTEERRGAVERNDDGVVEAIDAELSALKASAKKPQRERRPRPKGETR